MKLDVLTLSNFMDGDACHSVVAEMREAAGRSAPVYGTSEKGTFDERVRKVRQAAVSASTIDAITTRIEEQLPAIGSHFGYDLTSIEPLQFLHYAEGDFFVAHQDGNTPLIRDDTMHRRVSISIFLNDRSEYSGGSLLLHGAYPDWEYRENISGDAGALVAFRSETTHEVIPITAGERFVIVTWLRWNYFVK